MSDPEPDSAAAARIAVLRFAELIGEQETFAAFVDAALVDLGRLLGAQLVTFNRLDMVTRRATVITRPFRPELVVAVDEVRRMLREHPLLAWAPHQAQWPVVRLSEVATPQQLDRSPLYRDILRPIGAAFSLFIFVSSTQSSQWVYFVANRPESDFTQAAVEVGRSVQPALVTALARWSRIPRSPQAVTLTPRERAVLGFLAAGLTAEAMGRALGTHSATVRKHLQNIYRKFGVQDRLVAVTRGRELGFLNEEDLAGDLAQMIQTEMTVVAPIPTHSEPGGLSSDRPRVDDGSRVLRRPPRPHAAHVSPRRHPPDSVRDA